MTQHVARRTSDEINRLHIEIKRLRAKDTRLRALVAEQAEDDGLWFIAEHAPEAYLQQELRALHAAVEEEP